VRAAPRTDPYEHRRRGQAGIYHFAKQSGKCRPDPYVPRPLRPSIGPPPAFLFIERTEEQVEQRRSGRRQDQDLDLPRRTVSLEERSRRLRAITGSIDGCCRRMAEGPGVPSQSDLSLGPPYLSARTTSTRNLVGLVSLGPPYFHECRVGRVKRVPPNLVRRATTYHFLRTR